MEHKSRAFGKTQLIDMIETSLASRQDDLTARFSDSYRDVGVRYVAIDDLLPEEVAKSVDFAFPDPAQMRLMSSFREKKFTSKAYDKFDPILGDLTFAFQDPKVVKIIENITGIKEQVPDSLLYAGGLSAMGRDHFLSPHIDNSHDSSRTYYRTLNLLYYVSHDWHLENGGNLQLWNEDLTKNTIIHSCFNRLVLMETTPTSWHSVEKVSSEGLRKCVSNYYFSKVSPTGNEYFNVTAFSASPGQPLVRALSRLDAGMRQLVRKVRPSGIGPIDVYDGPPR